jgi:hypothetical protein
MMLPETMQNSPSVDENDEGLLPAGKLVPAGHYRRVDVAAGRVIRLEGDDFLPASCDGHVAHYERIVHIVNPHLLEEGQRAS